MYMNKYQIFALKYAGYGVSGLLGFEDPTS